jgi:hypothetical protein
MENTIITFPTAKLAKEKGFNISVEWYYPIQKTVDGIFGELSVGRLRIRNSEADMIIIRNDAHAFAPEQSLIQKWLRENHNIDIVIHRSFTMIKSYHYAILVNQDFDGEKIQECIPDRTYEEALENAINVVLNLI